MGNPAICVPVCAPTWESLERQIVEAAVYADVIELRLDCLENISDLLTGLCEALGKILDRTATPLLLTLRSSEEGGRSDVSLEQRLAFWKSRPPGQFIDLEIDIVDRIDPLEAILLVSHHDFVSVPSDLDELFDRLSETGAQVVKIAVMASDAVDAIPAWKLLRRASLAGKQVIPIAMGEAGKWTRILGPAHGAHLTYAALSENVSTAQGQIAARDMHEVYRVNEITPATAVYGVVGNPASTSLSPYFQNAAFIEAGLDAVFIPLQVGDLDSFVSRMVRPSSRELEINFRGFSVTMPHKIEVLGFLDEIDPIAAAVGAVNTIAVEGGRLLGYNTDVQGFIDPLRQRFSSLSGTRVAVFGSGGAALACLHGLSTEGAKVDVFVRDLRKASGKRLNDPVFPRSAFGERSREQPYDIVVNATPVGMKGDWENGSILEAHELAGVGLVYDLVTSPSETMLMRNARSLSIPVVGGIEMLLAQGVLQFKIWTGIEPSVDVMRKAITERL